MKHTILHTKHYHKTDKWTWLCSCAQSGLVYASEKDAILAHEDHAVNAALQNVEEARV